MRITCLNRFSHRYTHRLPVKYLYLCYALSQIQGQSAPQRPQVTSVSSSPLSSAPCHAPLRHIRHVPMHPEAHRHTLQPTNMPCNPPTCPATHQHAPTPARVFSQACGVTSWQCYILLKVSLMCHCQFAVPRHLSCPTRTRQSQIDMQPRLLQTS